MVSYIGGCTIPPPPAAHTSHIFHILKDIFKANTPSYYKTLITPLTLQAKLGS